MHYYSLFFFFWEVSVFFLKLPKEERDQVLDVALSLLFFIDLYTH